MGYLMFTDSANVLPDREGGETVEEASLLDRLTCSVHTRGAKVLRCFENGMFQI